MVQLYLGRKKITLQKDSWKVGSVNMNHELKIYASCERKKKNMNVDYGPDEVQLGSLITCVMLTYSFIILTMV